ncbi:MAG: hypothetical protein V3W19_01915 [Desulfatiglandales bacterium]
MAGKLVNCVCGGKSIDGKPHEHLCGDIILRKTESLVCSICGKPCKKIKKDVWYCDLGLALRTKDI